MNNLPDFLARLDSDEVERLMSLAERKDYAEGAQVFREGDQGDMFYLIDRGRVSIYLDQGETRHELRQLSAGDYFGEMALLNNDRRSASVVTLDATTLYRIDGENFKELVSTRPGLADRINRQIMERVEELILREHLVKRTGVDRDNLHIGISGDPTMRETALFREHRISEADRVINDLVEAVGDVLLNRSVFHLIVNFNSGEIRTTSVMSPFFEEVHMARKFVERPYLERHFPAMTYADKQELVQSSQKAIMSTEQFRAIPEAWQDICLQSCRDCGFMDEQSVKEVISRIKELRNIESLYLRNLTININQNVIRMQFNCDGTHIVDAANFERFIEENI